MTALRALRRPDLADRLAEVLLGLAPELIDLRRDLHAHPEPSWHEHRTTAVLLDRLVAAGLDAQVAGTGTGVVCEIGRDGPLVLLRGDIDALRLADPKDVPYRSTVEGVCHACGHDLHAVSALGAALALHRVLAETATPGRVRLLLQPAEEAIPSGAAALVAGGVADGIEAGFALHVDPSLPYGEVGISPGPVTSTADMLDLTLRGPGGHTGRPHLTADLAHLAARIVLEVPAGLSRLTDARDGVNLTFGSIQVGDAPNVIASEARLLGSLRTTGRSAWEAAPPIIERLVASIVEPFGATWELSHQVGAPPIVNDPWAAGVVARSAAHLLGPSHLHPMVQSGGGEDFAWFGEHAPIAYARLGVWAPGTPRTDIHRGSFDLDERAITLGAQLLAGAAVEALADLAEQPDGADRPHRGDGRSAGSRRSAGGSGGSPREAAP